PGTPLIVAVPLPLLAKITPAGNAPDMVRVGAGLPDATTVKDPSAQRIKPVLLAVGIVGADEGGGSAAGLAADCPPPVPQPARATRAMPSKIAKLCRANSCKQACAEMARRHFLDSRR